MRPTTIFWSAACGNHEMGDLRAHPPGEIIFRAGQTAPVGDNRALDLIVISGTICLFAFFILYLNRVAVLLCLKFPHYGSNTASIMWMTPFLARISTTTTLASLTLTPPFTMISTVPPLAMVASVRLTTSPDLTMPATT